MLVDGGVEIRAEPVGGGPELLVEVAKELLGEFDRASWQSVRRVGKICVDKQSPRPGCTVLAESA